MKLNAIAGSRALHCRRDQRVCENIESFVKIGPRVLGGHAGTETNPILRDGGIIDRRHPKTAPPQFMPQPIHALAIADDDRHHVRGRRSAVESQALKLRMEIIGVLPKLGAKFRLTRAELQCLENCRDHHRRQSAGINVRMCIETQILQSLFRPRDEASQRAESFRERPVNEWDAFFYAKLLSRATTMLAAC